MSGETSGSINVVNFTPDPPNPLLVDYESSDESSAEQECPSRDADGAVFDFGPNFGGDETKPDEMKPDETKAVEKKEFWFKKPTEESALEELSKKTFSANTDRKIDWAVGLFKAWRQHRLRMDVVDVFQIRWCDIDADDLNTEHLSFCLCCFVNEVRRQDGKEFPGKSLYKLVVLIQFYLECRGIFWKLIDGPEFKRVKFTLDNLMKKRASKPGFERQGAEAIPVECKEEMWKNGILGEETPIQLHHTVMYLLGLGFALRGGEEHRNLHAPGFDPQITVQKGKGHKFLLYQEDRKSKTNQGGITHRKYQPRTARIYENTENSNRCPVRLFEKYTSLLPAGKTNAFYKKEICNRKRSPKQWYVNKPIGINSLRPVIKSLCSKVGLSGKFTNHSLCVSAATRLYQKGVDEQTIKQFTGHKSDSIRFYKQSYDKILEDASDVVMTTKSCSLSATVSKPLPEEFDIDKYEIPEVKPAAKPVDNYLFVQNPAHKRPCKFLDDECEEKCKVLWRIDKETAKRKLKSLNIKLKFWGDFFCVEQTCFEGIFCVKETFCIVWFKQNSCVWELAKCLVNMFDFVCLWLRKSGRPKEAAK